MTEQQKGALRLAADGYRVFPAHGITSDGRCTCGKKCCTSPGKHPAVKGWQLAATKDVNIIMEMWAQQPLYNPAVATGTDLLVLDVDGLKGKASLQQLETQYGSLPNTRLVITGGGGSHYYFQTNKSFRNSAGKIAPGLDIRAEGGYVIGPGALHRNGNPYAWGIGCSPEEKQEAAQLPAWLEDLIAKPFNNTESANGREGGKAAYDWYVSNEPIEEGNPSRHVVLFRIACFLRGKKGMTDREIMREMKKINQERVHPPLTDNELKIQVQSACKYQRENGMDQVFNTASLRLVSFADVPFEAPRFLLHPYIPEGKLTILQGNPGDGKTAFICKLAAIVSSGGDLLENSCVPGNVLMLSVEDDASTLRGRIEASGGNLERCFFVSDAYELNLLSPELEEYIQAHQIKLLVFDPLQAFLGRSLDMNKSNETRPVLAALAAMAEHNKCAVILVSHLNKGTKEGPAIYRSLGSIDIPGAARSVIHIGRNARDLEQCIAVHVKSSNTKPGSSIAFRIGARGGVIIEGASYIGYEELAIVGRKTRMATHSFLAEKIIAACKRVLKQHPNGKKITYNELGVVWPENIKPKQLLDALRGRLEREGIALETGVRLPQGNGVIITRCQVTL